MGAKGKPMSKLTIVELRAESDRLAGVIAEVRVIRHKIADRIRELQATEREEDDGS
ncbi:hypothetical protein LCGC14_0401110 [marine sediment metagenome]|uniref:Uncharacterized protein n=1 Tax=marine sediment metagenome TaxID=412755 RepID=A0A0F9W5W7_9ZZZZ